jgi:hypothetical protein
MITQVHILTTYMCTMSCEHCFVCSSPNSQGTYTPSQITALLDQTDALGTVDTIYFEGGEPFLFYPVLLDGIRQARSRGYSVGIVTNGYFATSEENARCFMEPFAGLGIKDLSISDDVFHYENRKENAARCAFKTAKEMGLPAVVLALDPGASGPGIKGSIREERRGVITGGGIMFRGRAAEKLSPYADANDWQKFTTCPYEDLKDPSRLHVDAFGNLQICRFLTGGRHNWPGFWIIRRHRQVLQMPAISATLLGSPVGRSSRGFSSRRRSIAIAEMRIKFAGVTSGLQTSRYPCETIR